MKRVNYFIILLCFFPVAGCKTTAWYQSGKTLSQAAQDCEECKYEVMKFSNPYSKPQSSMGYFVGQDTELLMQCMKLRGYVWRDVTDAVKSGRLQIRENIFDPWYTVVGE